MYKFKCQTDLIDAGKVFVCGNNDCGQIGLRSVTSQSHLYPCPITNEPVVQIVCGQSHSAFITGNNIVTIYTILLCTYIRCALI